jgi:large subunit ribosomal protein L19
MLKLVVVRWDGPLIHGRSLYVLRTSKYEGGHKMNEIIKSIEAEQLKANITDFNVGDTVQVYAKVKEGNRERLQVFEGTVIKRQHGGARETFTVRKTSNGIGVEKTWPLHSPSIDKIEVTRRGKARRAKLLYLRNRVGKKAKVKESIR